MRANRNDVMAGVLRFTVYDHFEESAQVCSIIEELSGIYDQPIALESSQERFTGKSFCKTMVTSPPEYI